MNVSAMPEGLKLAAVPDGFLPFNFPEGFATHVGPLYLKPGTGDAAPQIGFRVLPHNVNPVGICHGGMLVTVMDMAIGITISFAAKAQNMVPSVNLNCDFLAPAPLGVWVEARMDFVKTTPRTGFASGFLVGPDGPVLRASGICKIPSSGDKRFHFDRPDGIRPR